ncbi:MAG: T9SS type A sorting domain-containing protein [Flavobacteriales bacterium]|nr:T9SS type A sorting domain-containing protein [Flavobacteriales bacterium]
MYPNPNRGDQLFLNMYDFSTEVNTVTMDMFDIFGKRVMTRTFAVADGEMNQVVDLGSEFAAGLYMVNITAGETVKTERLVIE